MALWQAHTSPALTVAQSQHHISPEPAEVPTADITWTPHIQPCGQQRSVRTLHYAWRLLIFTSTREILLYFGEALPPAPAWQCCQQPDNFLPDSSFWGLCAKPRCAGRQRWWIYMLVCIFLKEGLVKNKHNLLFCRANLEPLSFFKQPVWRRFMVSLFMGGYIWAILCV